MCQFAHSLQEFPNEKQIYKISQILQVQDVYVKTFKFVSLTSIRWNDNKVNANIQQE